MTDKVQKIREEVERLKRWNNNVRDSTRHMTLQEEDFNRGKHSSYLEILNFIDSLQKEPVSEDLEKAANKWDAKASFTPFYMALDDKGNPNGVEQDYTTHAESFKAGAKWQKEQFEKNRLAACCKFAKLKDELFEQCSLKEIME